MNQISSESDFNLFCLLSTNSFKLLIDTVEKWQRRSFVRRLFAMRRKF
jgi:hypothetical protein